MMDDGARLDHGSKGGLMADDEPPFSPPSTTQTSGRTGARNRTKVPRRLTLSE